MLNHIGTQTIITQRLILRKFEIADTQSVFETWMSDPEVQNNYGENACETISETQQILEKWISSYDSNEFYRWSIILKETNRNIGQIAFYLMDSKNQRADVEYCIGQSFWGNGYASEALKALIEYAFRNVGINRVQAFHRSKNILSGKVLQKSGMKYEGTLRQYLIHKDEFDDCIMYAIIRDDWL
ncbi:putative ribosomal N-acetyltransferase YdaF [Desulfosporosinus acididurans]|uniref:Putative ribosomal N-acetyltransferase YdaF n=1 Tax=Desulfosporosinus acididurans TaxID=476652 RepID=A0A0J1FQI8_9FIRM|nr:GNAT family N-acetyltransferase [Desulfosporosinus acididurans]KLU65770.1 putative ribosomal N-acetyltransferase YdaF [Desulfosporosinus acididurans]